jgi:hypothetical protein
MSDGLASAKVIAKQCGMDPTESPRTMTKFLVRGSRDRPVRQEIHNQKAAVIATVRSSIQLQFQRSHTVCKWRRAMGRALIGALIAAFFGGGATFAQVSGFSGSPPGMGVTSPLSLQPGLPVQSTGNPMGSTELATPGTSPAPLTSGNMNCSGTGNSMSQSSTAMFDGGGMAGTASSACAGTGNANSSPAPLPKLSGGGVGIPMGSTELGDAGTSPMPAVPMTPLTPILPLSTGGAVPMLTVQPPTTTSPTIPSTQGSILSQGTFPCPNSRSRQIPGGC